MTDVLGSLPNCLWRGIILPVSSRTAEHSHMTVGHVVSGSQGENVEVTASHTWIYTLKLHARQDLNVIEYKNWLSQHYQEFFDAYMNTETGDYLDCFHGIRKCKPMSLSEEMTSKMRDGLAVTIKLKETIEYGAENLLKLELANIDTVISDSRFIDTSFEPIEWDNGTAPQQISSKKLNLENSVPGPPTVNPIDAVTGVLDQGNHIVTKALSIFADTEYRLQKLEESIVRTQKRLRGLTRTDRKNEAYRKMHPLLLRVRKTRLGIHRLVQQQHAKQRPIRTSETPWDMPIISVAQRYKLSLTELLKLNPHLSRHLLIPENTRIIHYKLKVAPSQTRRGGAG